jgi:hypothetical protein
MQHCPWYAYVPAFAFFGIQAQTSRTVTFLSPTSTHPLVIRRLFFASSSLLHLVVSSSPRRLFFASSSLLRVVENNMLTLWYRRDVAPNAVHDIPTVMQIAIERYLPEINRANVVNLCYM